MNAFRNNRIANSLLSLAAAFMVALPMATLAQTTQILPTVTLVAGNHTAGNSGNGGPATSAMLGTGVSSAVYDTYGNLYIADNTNKVIRKVDAATGIISIFAGGGTGTCATQTDTVGDGCLATQAVFQSMNNIRLYKGELYIVDFTDNRVRKITLSNNMINIVLGTGVSGSVTYDVGSDTIVRTPESVAFNSRGDIFVVQNVAPRVDRIDVVTGKVASFVGTGVAGKSGDGTANGALSSPVGIAIDSQDNVYIADKANNCIRKVTVANAAALTGTMISTYAGPQGTATTSGYAGDGQTADNALFGASGIQNIYIDAQDNLYVVDNTDYRIRKIAPPTNGQTAIGGIVSTVAGNGLHAAPGVDGNYALNTALINPFDVTISPAGDLLVTDKNSAAVRLIAPVSVFPATAVGTAAPAQTIWANTATAGTFSVNGPADFTVGATTCAAAVAPLTGQACSANVVFKPTLSGRRSAGIVFTDAAGVAVTNPVSGTGLAPAASVLPGIATLLSGSSTGASGSTGDGTNTALFKSPGSVVTDSLGNSYIADTGNNTVRKLAPNGTVTRVAGTTGSAGYSGDGAAATSAKLNAPSAVAIDAAGDLFIADTGNNVVRRVDAASGIITTLAGTGTAGYTGDGRAATAATLSAPAGLAYNPTGVLLVADTGNNVIRAIGIRSGVISTYAGTGVAGFSGDGSSATSALLNGPTGLALDLSGDLYIADTANHRVREIDSTTFIKTLAGVGIAAFADGSAAVAELSSPRGVAVDGSGNVYVADTGNNRIRLISAGNVSTVAGGALAGLANNGGTSTLAQFNAPSSVSLDSANNLILADTSNNEIRGVTVGTSAMAFAETTPGTSSVSQQVNLYNSGTSPLNLTLFTIPAGFASDASGTVDCSSAPITIAAGSSCAVKAHFAPLTLTQYNGNITLTDNAQSVATSTQTVAVSGLGRNVFQFTVTLPATVTAGVPFSVTVKATNPVLTYGGTITFSSSDTQKTLPANYTFVPADNGTHTFTGVVLGTAGIQTITVTDTSDTQQSGTGSTTVTPGAAKTVAVLSGSPQSANIGANFAAALVAHVLDAYGNSVPNVAVTFTAPTTGVHASFGGTSSTYATTSNSLGLASTAGTTLTADFITGTYNVVASAPGVTTTASFVLTNTSTVAAGFTITPVQAIVGTVLPGAPSTQTLTITPAGGFYAAIALTCSTSDASTGCSLTPTTTTAADGTSQTVQLTFTTTGPNRTGGSAIGATWIGLLALAGITAVTFRRRRAVAGIALSLLCLVGSTSLIGCSATTLSQPRTASGSVFVTVTGTAGSITNSTKIEYVVGGD